MDKTPTQTMARNGISKGTRVIKRNQSNNHTGTLWQASNQTEQLEKPAGSPWAACAAGDLKSCPLSQLLQSSFSFSTAAKSKQASDLHSCLKKYTTSYLGLLSCRSVKYSLIKYSLAKNTAEIMIQTKLLLSTCLWVFVVIGQFLVPISKVLKLFRVQMCI